MKPDQPTGAPAAYVPTPADLTIQRFITAQRLHALYPANNPNVRTAVSKLREMVKGFSATESFHIEVEKEQLKFGSLTVMPHVNEVRDLAQKLYLAHVQAVSMEPEVSDEEIVAFLDVLRLKGEDRRPFDEELPPRGVVHIQVREAGRMKIVETEAVDPDSWDIISLAELEDLDEKLLGGAGKGALKEALRAVGAGQDLKRARLMAVLERPAEFARLLVELASRLKPRGTIDLNAQIELLQAMLAQMESVVEMLPETDRIRMYVKLDEVVAQLASDLHTGVIASRPLPFVRLGGLKALFPDRLREMSLEEALSPHPRPGAGLTPILVRALRRFQADDSRLASHLSPIAPPPVTPDPAFLMAYRPAPRAAAAASPAQIGADFYAPASRGAFAAEEGMLAAATRAAIGVIDSLSTLADLMAAEADAGAYSTLLGHVVDRFGLALNLRNVELAAAVLGALHAERLLKKDRPEQSKLLEEAIFRCGEPEMMQLYAVALADAPSGGDAQRKIADLLQGLEANAVSSLVEILAVEPLQSTRRKLLDALATVARMRFDLIISFLNHPQWYVVRNIVWVLGRIGPEATGAIRRVSTHRDPRVRREAARSLAQIGGGEALKALTGYLFDKDDSVLREAAAKLALARVAEAVPALHAAVQSPGFVDREGETMLALGRALAAVGGAESAELLERTAEAKVVKGWLRAPEVKKGLRESATAIRQRLAQGKS